MAKNMSQNSVYGPTRNQSGSTSRAVPGSPKPFNGAGSLGPSKGAMNSTATTVNTSGRSMKAGANIGPVVKSARAVG